jgi:nucleotide-binding universal stress UspA family protein
MFKTILLPVDLSDRHGPALDAALTLASQAGGEVVLLHVIEIIQGLPLDEEKGFYNRLEKAARTHLEKLRLVAKERNARCRGEILYGNRGRQILAFARESNVDLIVLTAPRMDPSQPAVGWGSLSYKVGIFSACPVLLVK